MDKSLSEQQIHVSASIFCIGRITGPIPLPPVGLMAGREAGQQTKCRWVLNFLYSLQVKLLTLLFCLLSQQCYYSIRIAFQADFVK